MAAILCIEKRWTTLAFAQGIDLLLFHNINDVADGRGP